jgi:hypothetical protein
MLSVANKHIMLSIIMLTVVMLSVVAPLMQLLCINTGKNVFLKVKTIEKSYKKVKKKKKERK